MNGFYKQLTEILKNTVSDFFGKAEEITKSGEMTRLHGQLTGTAARAIQPMQFSNSSEFRNASKLKDPPSAGFFAFRLRNSRVLCPCSLSARAADLFSESGQPAAI